MTITRPTRDMPFANVYVDEDGCWLWTRAVLANGYGRIGKFYAHRVYFELFKGEIPEGLEIDHLCSVRHCVNPDHLEAVTHAENIRRRDERLERVA